MRRIKLTQGQYALVDDDLFDDLNKFKWCAAKRGLTFYANRAVGQSRGRFRTCDMHREIFRLRGKPVPKEVDHKDRNGLNNQWTNLRPATRCEQNRNHGKRKDNTSGFIGVSWYKINQKWASHARIDGQLKYLGLFNDPFSAAWIRDEFVKSLDPKFWTTNELVDRRKRTVKVNNERRAKRGTQ